MELIQERYDQGEMDEFETGQGERFRRLARKLTAFPVVIAIAIGILLTVPNFSQAAFADTMRGAWTKGDVALQYGETQQGITYAWGGGNEFGPSKGTTEGASALALADDDEDRIGYDCSGLTTRAEYKAGFNWRAYVPDLAAAGYHVRAALQESIIKNYGAWYGTDITRFHAGDLVFWNDSNGVAEHVAMFAGYNKSGTPLVLQSPGSGQHVEIHAYYTGSGFVGGGRLPGFNKVLHWRHPKPKPHPRPKPKAVHHAPKPKPAAPKQNNIPSSVSGVGSLSALGGTTPSTAPDSSPTSTLSALSGQTSATKSGLDPSSADSPEASLALLGGNPTPAPLPHPNPTPAALPAPVANPVKQPGSNTGNPDTTSGPGGNPGPEDALAVLGGGKASSQPAPTVHTDTSTSPDISALGMLDGTDPSKPAAPAPAPEPSQNSPEASLAALDGGGDSIASSPTADLSLLGGSTPATAHQADLPKLKPPPSPPVHRRPRPVHHAAPRPVHHAAPKPHVDQRYVGWWGNDNPHKVLHYLMAQLGLDRMHASAFVGNFMQESGPQMSSTIAQYGGGPGRGMAQWELANPIDGGGRFNELESFAHARGLNPWDAHTQAMFMVYELHGGYANALAHVRVQHTLAGAVSVVCAEYESAGHPDLTQRIQYARQIWGG